MFHVSFACRHACLFHRQQNTNINMSGTSCFVCCCLRRNLAIVLFGHCTWRRHFHSSVSVILGWRLWCYVVQCLLNFWWDWWRCWDVCTLKKRHDEKEKKWIFRFGEVVVFPYLHVAFGSPPLEARIFRPDSLNLLTMWHNSSFADAQMEFDNLVRRLNSNAACFARCIAGVMLRY